MTRKPLIAANWKMHKTIVEALRFVDELQSAVGPCDDREVVLAPPFTALDAVGKALRQRGFALAAQNCHWEEKGAYTGEIALAMLAEVGCRYVIVGHSERRQLFGETDQSVNRKVAAVYRHVLVPILCIGETLAEREGGETFAVVARQLTEAVRGLNETQLAALVIAYEPVWAIGTGRNATPEQAQEVHRDLRGSLAELADKIIASRVRIVYGGSVKPDNVDSLMAQPDVDGFLVGGASLEVASFRSIVRYRE
jgi:triosephosphate isomerase